MLPTGYGNSLIYQVLALLTKRAGIIRHHNYVSHNASFQNYEDEAINLTAYNLAQKLVCLEDIKGDKFDVVYSSAESATDEVAV